MDRERIIIMSKLAVYDKNYGEKDRQANMFFRTDYVYRKNMWARFYVFLGCLLIVGLYAVRLFTVDGYDVFDFDYLGALINVGAFILVVLVIYTLICTQMYVAEFNQAQRRLENYMALIKRLNNTSDDDESQADDHEQEELKRGDNIFYTRSDSELL